MKWWRNCALVLVFSYLIFWLHAPLLFAMYLIKSPVPFLAWVCFPMFISNGVLMYEGHSPLRKFGDKLLEERNELKFLIESEKIK